MNPTESVASLWHRATNGDAEAMEELLKRFDPLIRKEARIDGQFDEDVAQDIREAFFRALLKLKEKHFS